MAFSGDDDDDNVSRMCEDVTQGIGMYKAFEAIDGGRSGFETETRYYIKSTFGHPFLRILLLRSSCFNRA